jgi:HEPN domain-containing protein
MAEHNPVVQEWISKAEGDWDWTVIDVDSVTARMRDGYVYHLQQYIEKLFKACLLHQGQTFQKTHDLVRLSQLLQAADPDWSWDEDELEDLTESGVMNRYPGCPALPLWRRQKPLCGEPGQAVALAGDAKQGLAVHVCGPCAEMR